ncbi:suppressor of cytokine signaling 2 [Euwallacea similis]|uniref:suppressor of cytokine signaling 2 n=1 Tax=Euwallacea similis TaxID=1736056 RepID=UPI00344D9DD1
MNSHSDRAKCWFHRIRYLKVFKNTSSNFTKQSPVAQNTNIIDYGHHCEHIEFHHSMSPNLTSEISDLKSETTFRRSIRKWHKRMKNCFSKRKHCLGPKGTTNINPELGQTISTQMVPTSEQHNCVNTVNVSLTPSSSRLAVEPDDQHRSPTNSHLSENAPKNEISTLAHQVWYWGPVSKQLVEAKLEGAPDGSFLVRDSASDRHIFSISFRSVGKTLHTRIESTESGYKVFDHKGFETVKDLIDEAIKISAKETIFCYTRSLGLEPNYPVRLLKPISRYDEVRSLQNLSRFVIRQHINVNDIEKLCLPARLISFLKEENYF